MEKKFGFSLAEALITLLIVSIIAIVSAPLVTKKSRKIDNKTVWSINTDNYATISPTDGRDIRLGKTRSGKSQGIVVVDRLEFKNKNGQVIGWIDEDGSTSFSGVSSEMLHEELTKLITELSKDMQAMLNTSKPNNEKRSVKKTRPSYDTGQTQPIEIFQSHANNALSDEQKQEMENLTKELFKLLEISNR